MVNQISLFMFVNFSLVVFLSALFTVFGCGQLLQGQEVVRFTVQGTQLPTVLAYSNAAAVHAQVPAISRSEQPAKTLIQNLIMRAVEDVLEQQGRNALLPNAVISIILQQLTINTTYTPLQCGASAPSGMMIAAMPNMGEGCIITGDFVVMLCMMYACDSTMMAHLKPVPSNFMSFTGTLSTSNIIMATWSRSMWADVLNRVQQKLSADSTSLGAFFTTATVMQN